MTERAEFPERIAHYRIVEEVWCGEVATVYRAVDETLERDIALKVLRDTDAADRLIQEARRVSGLQHNFIAAVYQAGVEDGVQYIAFEWVEGHTLRQRLQARGMPLEEFYRRAAQVAGAVAHAHEMGMVHGDLKADNIVLKGDYELKLLDFGLSPEEEGVGEGDLWGTPAYMAPELLEGGTRTQQSDRFALGVLLYEMATGVLPFGGEDGDEDKVYAAQKEGSPIDPRERVPQLARPVSRAILSLLSTDPNERTPDPGEFRKLLKAHRPGKKASGIGLLFWVFLLVAIVFYWQYGRQLGLPWPGAVDDEATEEIERQSIAAVRFEGPSGADSEASRFGADLVTILLNGVDPGSALLNGIETPASIADADSTPLHLGGTWGRTEDGWQVEWTLAEPGAEQPVAQGVESFSGADPVGLARRLITSLGERVDNRVAETLGDGEGALTSFMEAVRAIEGGQAELGLEKLRAAQQQAAGVFPEAAAWEAALLIVQGRYADQSSRFVDKLRPLTSAPGVVITSALIVPVQDVGRRWGQRHRLARELDFVLHCFDPGTDDGEVARAGAEVDPANPYLRRLRIERALAAGDLELADRLLPEEQGHGWERIVWARWAELLRGNPDRAKEILEDWLLIEADDGSLGGFLKIPFLFQQGRLSIAARQAQRLVVQDRLPVVARETAVLTFAIAGQFRAGSEAAGAIVDPLDPTRTERMQAAVLALSGDREGAENVLRAARKKGELVETEFLLEFLAADDPYKIEIPELAGEVNSPRARWLLRFASLTRARELRTAGDVAGARSELARLAWVGADMRILAWPELGYLAWLEQIRCRLAEHPDGVAARIEFGQFREWWPTDRPEGSRVSVEAAAVATELGVTE